MCKLHMNSLCSVASVMVAKRRLKEFGVSSMKQSPNAIVHGIVTCFSPIKKSKKNENFGPVSVVYEAVVSLAFLEQSQDLF